MYTEYELNNSYEQCSKFCRDTSICGFNLRKTPRLPGYISEVQKHHEGFTLGIPMKTITGLMGIFSNILYSGGKRKQGYQRVIGTKARMNTLPICMIVVITGRTFPKHWIFSNGTFAGSKVIPPCHPHVSFPGSFLDFCFLELD